MAFITMNSKSINTIKNFDIPFNLTTKYVNDAAPCAPYSFLRKMMQSRSITTTTTTTNT